MLSDPPFCPFGENLRKSVSRSSRDDAELTLPTVVQEVPFREYSNAPMLPLMDVMAIPSTALASASETLEPSNAATVFAYGAESSVSGKVGEYGLSTGASLTLVMVTAIDLVWGTCLTATAATAGYLAARLQEH